MVASRVKTCVTGNSWNGQQLTKMRMKCRFIAFLTKIFFRFNAIAVCCIVLLWCVFGVCVCVCCTGKTAASYRPISSIISVMSLCPSSPGHFVLSYYWYKCYLKYYNISTFHISIVIFGQLKRQLLPEAQWYNILPKVSARLPCLTYELKWHPIPNP